SRHLLELVARPPGLPPSLQSACRGEADRLAAPSNGGTIFTILKGDVPSLRRQPGKLMPSEQPRPRDAADCPGDPSRDPSSPGASSHQHARGDEPTEVTPSSPRPPGEASPASWHGDQ